MRRQRTMILLGMLIVHSLNEIYTRPNPPARLDKFDDICQFCRIMLGPLTTGICLTILNNDQIQQSYHEVLLRAMDGCPEKFMKFYDLTQGDLRAAISTQVEDHIYRSFVQHLKHAQ